ncbi:MAG: hypothetical protein KatS3mg127_0447 [Silanimonas sp.]|nr:MAG: hypothetical protein KatS3mg127_0447 [Silanimonas sp.]
MHASRLRTPRTPRLALAAGLTLAAPFAALANGPLHGTYVGLDLQADRGERQSQTTLGGAWASESQALRDFVSGLDAGARDDSGFGQGLHLGYLHAPADGLLLGVEFGFEAPGAEVDARVGPTSAATPATLNYTIDAGLDFDRMLVLRGLVGWQSGDHAFYASVGGARADLVARTGITSNGGYAKAGLTDDSRSGLHLGLGWRRALGEHWSIRAEVTQADLGDVEVVNAYLPGSSFTDPAYTERYRIEAELRQVRVGVSYRFR